MDGIGRYLLSVICVSVIVAIVTGFVGKKTASAGIIKLISGVFIIFTVVAPVVKVEFQELQDFYNGISFDAGKIAKQGELMAQQSTQAIIKEQLEAYILDKASSLNLDVDVSITLKDTDLATPEKITISGNASPYGKEMLQAFLVEEIGIPEEMQLWR